MQSSTSKLILPIPVANKVPDIALNQPSDEAPIFVRVAHQILEAIGDKSFPAGERLPSEQSLADRFGVSRPSLREALSALQFAGYLASKQGFGTIVVSREDERPRRRDSSIRVADPVDVLQARLAIEPQAVAVAAQNPDPRHLKQAREILDGMWLAVDSANDLGVKTDINLHVAMVNICRNRFLRTIAIDLMRQTNPPRWSNARSEVWANPDVLEGWAAEHEATLAAIEARNMNRAMRCSRRHLLSTIESLTRRQHIAARDRKRLRAILKHHASGPGD
jgi:GntR family transcriptional repressor for pyruvate dehydrogenase complex